MRLIKAGAADGGPLTRGGAKYLPFTIPFLMDGIWLVGWRRGENTLVEANGRLKADCSNLALIGIFEEMGRPLPPGAAHLSCPDGFWLQHASPVDTGDSHPCPAGAGPARVPVVGRRSGRGRRLQLRRVRHPGRAEPNHTGLPRRSLMRRRRAWRRSSCIRTGVKSATFGRRLSAPIVESQARTTRYR